MTAVCCGYECHFKYRQLRENAAAAAAAAAVWKLEIQIYANNQIQLYPPCENDAAEQSEWAGEQCATGDDSEILPAKIVPEKGVKRDTFEVFLVPGMVRNRRDAYAPAAPRT